MLGVFVCPHVGACDFLFSGTVYLCDNVLNSVHHCIIYVTGRAYVGLKMCLHIFVCIGLSAKCLLVNTEIKANKSLQVDCKSPHTELGLAVSVEADVNLS